MSPNRLMEMVAGAAVAIRPALQRNGYPGPTGRCGRDCGNAETERIGMEP